MKKYLLGIAFLILGLSAFSQVSKADAEALLTRFDKSSPTSVEICYFVSGFAPLYSFNEDRLISVAATGSGISISYTSTKGGVGELFMPYPYLKGLRADKGTLTLYVPQ
jgi:hypothetical protein